MKSIIIRGPLAVGKSTVAKPIAKMIGGVYISVDDVLNRNGLDKAIESDRYRNSNCRRNYPDN